MAELTYPNVMTNPCYYLNIKDLSRDVQRLAPYYFNYGEFADIWKVAVKALRVRKNDITKSLLDIFHVWNYLTMLGHPNIVPFYGFTMDTSSGHLPSIVIPLYQNGNALSYIETHPKADKLRLIIGVACALDYLHNLPTTIVHGDLKASNVLVTDDGVACLTDIGLASVVSQEDFTSAKIAGNCRWSPPEVLDPPMTPAGDVYSWGMTALEIYTGQHPFSHIRNDAAVIFDILKGLRPRRPDNPEVTEGLWNIWTDCWATEPKQRPTMDSVLAELGVCLDAVLSLHCMIHSLDAKQSVQGRSKPYSELVNNATPLWHSVSAESGEGWDAWWQENTKDMGPLLRMCLDFDPRAKMECIMLAFSAKIYQRLVVYVYVQMKAFSDVHEHVHCITRGHPHRSLNSLRGLISEWEDWDDLQWLASYHVVRRTLWDTICESGMRIPKGACNIQRILDFDMNVIQGMILGVLNDREVKRKFLALCQSDPTPVANLFQTLLDQDNLPSESRSLLARALARLAKSSRCYPDCLILTTIRRTGTDPVAGGGFADVWKGYFAEKLVALKALRNYKQSTRKSALKEFSHEAVIWRQLRHPNILPFYGVFTGDEDFDRLCLVSPWMDAGNVIDYLKDHPDSNRLSLLSDVAQGLEYLHLFEPPIIHGDLKGANIFVSASLTACLGDFGLARFRDSQESTLGATGNTTGTLRWQAPELLQTADDGESLRRSEKCDIYSFGCVCLELMTGKPPFSEIRRDGAVMMAIAKGQIPQRPMEDVFDRGLDDTLWDLMRSCWNFDPALRPKIRQIAEFFESHLGTARLGAKAAEDTFHGVRASLGQYGFPDHFVSEVQSA